MENNRHFVIDFDSTFTQVEALDVLGEISLEGHPEKEQRLQKLVDLTNQGMGGQLAFRDSLSQRLELLDANRKHLQPLIENLRQKVSVSFVRNEDFFKEYRDRIYIVSNGFKEFIVPIVQELGVKPENVFANTFEFDENGDVTGFDHDNVLSSNNGKVEQLKRLDLKGDVYVIGDGYTDYEIKAAGLANKFYAFTENVSRENILENADHITPSLDEFLYVNKMNKAISYPKNRIKVLLLENVHADAVDIMKKEGYNVSTISGALDEEELSEKIKDVSILGIRSKTQLTAKVLENANRLIAVGAFCIGTNQIDLEACLNKGVAVFNAPFSNTRSVVELAIGEIILLMRNLPDRIAEMHQGQWNKSAKGSYEIRGKKLGIVGYGNIGSQLSVVAEAIGFDVYYYDLVEKLALGNATKCSSLEELFKIVDVVTLHVDGRKENTNMIGDKQLSWLKEGSYFLNLARGQVVDVDALKKHIESGRIAGAGVDVFPKEPKTNQEEFQSVLRGLPNLILTPHIGGSTEEAQENIGNFVPGKIINYINTGGTTNSVNFPNLQLPTLENAHRLIHIHHNKPGIIAHINRILAANDINIVGQYLKTNETIGYVITDIDKEYDDHVIEELKAIQGTIKFRVLY
ncbi:MAG: phosphoglycerate dehydrogenase [Bacteroidota bacterium]|uniref:D-3-phosphoglycerate dehydrogenase n=1 Tax=Christiangramia flava JLT2011 TaxID=1229726 RepID=A0A1L7I065_9FLAO|nr:phosphoglycerate dehydrogenase [Christiangramia flava]APU66986.1 D-3-phosphoglycerate dehydrogenase [Christiangramia flava JLT2011]MAM18152.1 phosphoglycerate dehydrogenase [Christiangramia sp.]MEE2771530.1 phosphoglycerate dehydrogenase [Bacteroidota bacterium]OSS38658.1 D-3-phosphoglycerate dehydrogenase [Christiangramia flava JLT2011]